MRRLFIPAAALLALAGCSEFPCRDEAQVMQLEQVSIPADGEARFTYWYADGAQQVVFSRDDIPEVARHSVLVHIPGKTTPDLHGATGWVADVSDTTAVARRAPMAVARARALSARSGAWSADWVQVRAEQTAAREALHAKALEADGTQAPAPVVGAEAFKKELLDEGIAVDALVQERALRSVAARQPLPRDFGLSLRVEPVWLFVDPDCSQCEKAASLLTKQGIGHHILRVTDPTNAATLRMLSGAAKAVVPTMWVGSTLVRGFDTAAFDAATRNLTRGSSE